MAWTKAQPAARILANTLAGLLRTNNLALETAIDQDHDFSTSGTQTGVHDQVTMPEITEPTGKADHITHWNEGGIPKWKDATAGTLRKISSDGDVIPAGTKMYFYANAAPTGWTIYNTVVDCLLAVKSASGTYATGGDGAEKGTWSHTGHVHGTVDLTLTAAESGVPAHTHAKTGEFLEKADGTANIGVLVNSGTTTTSANSAADAAEAHNHGDTETSAEANTYRPLAAVGILATKDAY